MGEGDYLMWCFEATTKEEDSEYYLSLQLLTRDNKSIEQVQAHRKTYTFFQTQTVGFKPEMGNFATALGKQSENLNYGANGYALFINPKENCQTTVTKVCIWLGIASIKELRKSVGFCQSLWIRKSVGFWQSLLNFFEDKNDAE